MAKAESLQAEIEELDEIFSARSAGQVADDFLERLDPDGWHNLVAIDPNGDAPIESRTFDPRSHGERVAWIDAREGRRNLYFTANEPRAGAPHQKPSGRDIASMRVVHCDVDPPDSQSIEEGRAQIFERIRVLDGEPVPPSFVVDSGGGVQVLWVLDAKRDATISGEEIEALNRGLIRDLGGDAGTWNRDRLLRLPGTTNLPDAKKRAKGRVARRASLLSATGARYTPQAIAGRFPPAAVGVSGAAPGDELRIQQAVARLKDEHYKSAANFEDLDDDLRRRFEHACAARPKLRGIWEGSEDELGADKSGSGRRFVLAMQLGLAGGFDVEDFAALVWSCSFGVQAGDDPDEKLTPRALARDWARGGAIRTPQALVERYWQDPSPVASAVSARTSAGLSGDHSTATDGAIRRFTLESFDHVAQGALTHTAKPLIKGLLDQSAMTVLYGESNVGKTFVALDIAHKIASGRPWGGMRSTKLPVVYVVAEGGRAFMKRAAALKVREPDAETSGLYILAHPVDLLHADADVIPLIESIRELGSCGLVVIDTLSRAMAGGDENASTDMGVMVKHLDAIRKRTGAHLLVVHHSGKDRAKGARGHSLLRAATDTEIEVSDGEIRVTKQRDLEKVWRSDFALEPVTLGVDDEGDPITSATIRLIAADPDELASAAVGTSERVASIVFSVLAGRPSAPLGELRAALTERLNAAGLCKGTSRQAVSGIVTDHIGGRGVEIRQDGQAVRLRASKDGRGEKAPWVITASRSEERTLTDCQSEIDVSHASLASEADLHD